MTTAQTTPRVPLLSGRPWWHKVLMIIGILTVITFIGAVIFGIDAKPDDITVTGRLGAIDSLEFRTAVARLVAAPLEQGGTVDVLSTGDAFLASLLTSLKQARSTINFSVFMWQDGRMSDQVLDALIERQRAGVAVRVLLDGLGSTGSKSGKWEELKLAGGRVASYRTPKFGSWTRFHRRNHRRAIVIDGEAGFTGGMAVNDTWLGHAQDPDHWRDFMFKLTGHLATSLQSAFADTWAGVTGELLGGTSMYPPDVLAGPIAGPHFVHLANSPADDDQSMAYFFIAPILAAQTRIVIATPYFIPDTPLRDALINRAKAGVDVSLLLPGTHIDNPWVRRSGQSHFDALLEAGVKIYEYKPTFLHAKYLVADGKWSIIGSPNLNTRSRQLDEENAFGILDEALARQLEQEFAADVRVSLKIEHAWWRNRGWFRRLMEQASRILDQQS